MGRTSKFSVEERKARRRAYCAKWARDRRKTDPLYAKKLRDEQRKRRADPVFRAAELAAGRKRSERIDVRAKMLLKVAQARAVARSQPFTLTLQHVVDGLSKGTCPRTGVRFNLKTGNGIGPRSPSLDRIRPAGPYSNKNVQIVCWQYNVMKQRLTDAQLLKFCKAVVKLS